MVKSRKMRWAEHVASVKDLRNAYRILAGEHECKKLLGRHRYRYKCNIKVDIVEIVYELD
jgi:hypothetical protein